LGDQKILGQQGGGGFTEPDLLDRHRLTLGHMSAPIILGKDVYEDVVQLIAGENATEAGLRRMTLIRIGSSCRGGAQSKCAKLFFLEILPIAISGLPLS
jgi:hypothetical protein